MTQSVFQQCLEKTVKALLVLNDIGFPKTHDINSLVKLLPEAIQLPLSDYEQELLTYYSTSSRYPGDPEPYTRIDAENAVYIAKKIRDRIKIMFPPETSSSP